ncbi:hypothetical protein RIF29_03690 [Crotalaria pallida]|uniref:Uncharacterized protein n=1 Tax=Crotalaria pallida TaxID=3830 RepID=A0AAN9J1I9_CROPI
MARKRGRPPKTPSFVNKSALNKDSDQDGTPSKVDFSQLDDDDIEDIDNLTPKQAAVWIQKIDVLRAKIQERTDPTSSKDKSDKSDASHDNITPNPSLTEEAVHDKPSSDSVQEAIINETIPPENVESAKEEAEKVLAAATTQELHTVSQNTASVTDKGKGIVSVDEEGWIPVQTKSKAQGKTKDLPRGSPSRQGSHG